MAVISKDLVFESKSEKEAQKILSILNGDYPVSNEVVRRLNRLSKMTESLIVKKENK